MMEPNGRKIKYCCNDAISNYSLKDLYKSTDPQDLSQEVSLRHVYIQN